MSRRRVDEDNPFQKMVVKRDLRDVFDDERKDTGKKVYLPFVTAAILVYMEIMFHIFSFHKVEADMIGSILFTAAFGGLFGFLISLLPNKASRVVSILLTIVCGIYYCTQTVYKGVFQNYLSLSAMGGVAGQALDFMDTIIKNILENLVLILLELAPIALWFTPLKRHVDYKRKNLILSLIAFTSCAGVYVLGVFLIMLMDHSMYSAYDVFRENTSIDMAVQKLGVPQASLQDFGVMLGIKYKGAQDIENTDVFNGNEDWQAAMNEADGNSSGSDIVTEVDPDTGEVVQVEAVPKKPYNVMDIDFDELLAATNDKNLKKLNEYFKGVTPTKTNEYTGIFEGFNVIFISAEGFWGGCLSEEYFPTMSMMANNGFVFNNFYTPLWYGSTIAGEYANLTGLTPSNSYLSMKKTGSQGNSMMFCLPTQLAKLGYATVGYHNNSYTYYGRNLSHTNMGLTWVGVGNGWEPQRYSSGKQFWPQSDDYLIETTFFDYYDSEPFYTYYMSVSGHMQYNFSGNAMSKKNKDVFANTGYSDHVKAYLACQYELEKAMTRLVDYLYDTGLADHTVIVLSADHVPYDDKEVCDELSGRTLEGNFEWYENTLIVWSAAMDEPVQVDKLCSSIDILPTISNLLGLEYDSRLLVGRDILSDCEPLVMFNNRSFITDKCSYNASSGKLVKFTDDCTDEYVSAVKKEVKNRFNISDLICENDYYATLEKYYPKYKSLIVPEKVADRMAEAGFNPDGSEMSAAEKKAYAKKKAEKAEAEANYDPSDEELDANTPVPKLD